jgi:hypothetical protein
VDRRPSRPLLKFPIRPGLPDCCDGDPEHGRTAEVPVTRSADGLRRPGWLGPGKAELSVGSGLA